MSAAALKEGGLPLYRQVYFLIKDKIGGEWPAGMRLAPEPELARSLGVSRPTIRHALMLAEREGLVSRKRAKGTFIEAGAAVTSQKVTGSFVHLLRFDKRISVQVLPASQRGDLVPELMSRVAQLGFADAGRIRRKVLLEGAPLAYMENFVDKRVSEKLDVTRLSRTPLVALVEKTLKTKIATAREEIEAAIATPYLAHILEVGPGTPLLRVQRVYFQKDGQVIDYGIVWYRSDRYRFTVELGREEWGRARKAARGR